MTAVARSSRSGAGVSTPLRAIDGGGLGTPKLDAKGLLELPPLPRPTTIPASFVARPHVRARPDAPDQGGGQRALRAGQPVVLARATHRSRVRGRHRLDAPLRLIRSLSWRLPSDPLPPYKWSTRSHGAVLMMACGIGRHQRGRKPQDRRTFMHVASAIELHHLRPSGERYGAASRYAAPSVITPAGSSDHRGYLIDGDTAIRHRRIRPDRGRAPPHRLKPPRGWLRPHGRPRLEAHHHRGARAPRTARQKRPARRIFASAACSGTTTPTNQ